MAPRVGPFVDIAAAIGLASCCSGHAGIRESPIRFRIRPKIAFSIVVLLTAFTVLVGLSFRGSMVYYLTVSEYLAHPRTELDGHFRVNGKVSPGSIERMPGGLGARFQMTDGKGTLPVVFRKELPDTFVDDADVVVEGSMKEGLFEAQTLLAKCPSKYESQQKAALAPAR